MEALVSKKAEAVDKEVHPLIRRRWSPRVFQDREIEQDTLDQLFEAARWAASSSNEQPWRFIYAYKGAEAYEQILSCLSDFNRKWTGSAPVLMLTAIKEHFDSGKENYHALHDLGLAMGNFTIQAQQKGIAVHHMAGVDWQKAQEKFDVPEGYHIVTAVAIGYYGGDLDDLPEDLQKKETARRKRKELSEIVAEGQWPE